MSNTLKRSFNIPNYSACGFSKGVWIPVYTGPDHTMPANPIKWMNPFKGELVHGNTGPNGARIVGIDPDAQSRLAGSYAYANSLSDIYLAPSNLYVDSSVSTVSSNFLIKF